MFAPAGVTKDEFIIQLIKNTAAYNSNRVDYDLLPGIQDGYNSNSYFRGLAESAGGVIDANVNWRFAGYGKPVPAEYFGGTNEN